MGSLHCSIKKCQSAWQARPLSLPKSFWYASGHFGRLVDHYWKQKRLILSHVQHAVHRKIHSRRTISLPLHTASSYVTY